MSLDSFIVYAAPLLVLVVLAALLFTIRSRLAPKSSVAAALLAVAVAIPLAQIAAWYSAALSSPSVPITLTAAFVAMQSVQKAPWTVASLMRSLALIAGLVTLWAAYRENITATALSLILTVVLLYGITRRAGVPATNPKPLS